MERLQKVIASRGLCSRRTAEQWISEGRVMVNGQQATLGMVVSPIDEITIDGLIIPSEQKNVYIMLHKPRGYVTTLQDEHNRPTVGELVDCGLRVYPIGRLDYQSEGLLLFTNDGAFANKLMHPSGHVPKTYMVTVRGSLTESEELLRRPIVLDGYQIRSPIVKFLGGNSTKARYSITIYEGRNRQIRRMCEAANLQVLRLCRMSEGSLSLGNLPLGKWRYLTKEEVLQLQQER